MIYKRILVFGGNKFLGKNIVQQVKAKLPDAEIFSVTRSGTEIPNVNSIICDRTNNNELNKVLTGDFDIVFDVSAYQLETLKPSLEVLKGRVKTWAFVSSAGVYSKSNVFPLQSNFSKVETTSPHYGKFACEEALRNEEGLNTFCIRPFYIYGPENTFDREAFFFRAIEEEKELLIPNDGGALLQFASVKDTASVFVDLALLDSEKTNNKAFHPCDKSIYSLNGLIDVCAKVVGKEAKIKYFSVKEAEGLGVKSRDVFPLRAENYFGDIEDLSNVGLKTSDDLYAGLKETYEWFKNNREQYPSYSLMPPAEKFLVKV